MSADVMRSLPATRGYFAIGAERMSKSLNLGNLMRSAHGFGASFTFTLGATYTGIGSVGRYLERRQCTCRTTTGARVDEMVLPHGCKLVGVELVDDGDRPAELPPSAARGLCAGAGARRSVGCRCSRRCDYVVKIPTSFCVNVAMAGAIVMYDRVRTSAVSRRARSLKVGR